MADIDFSDIDFSDEGLGLGDDDLGLGDAWDGIDFSDAGLGLGDDSPTSEGYSALRSGVVDFVESATGWGTEADALYRRLSGEADTFDEAHRQSMKDLDFYEQDNEYANYLSTGVGFAAGFLIPGLALSKVGKVATTAEKAGAAWKAAGYGAIEGAVYGAGTGHTMEERGMGVAIGAGAGGFLSGGAAKFLIKSDEELTEAAKVLASQEGKGSHLGGVDGFTNSKATKSTAAAGKEGGDAERAVTGIDDTAKSLQDYTKDAGGSAYEMTRGMKGWMERHIGGRFAKLSEDAESMARRGRHTVDLAIGADTELTAAAKTVAGSPALKNVLVRIQPKFEDGSGLTWDAAMKAVNTNEERKALMSLKNYTRELQMQDPRNLVVREVNGREQLVFKETDFFPTEAIEAFANQRNKGRTEQYIDPIEALRKYAYDINDSLEMAKRFNVDPKDVIKSANAGGAKFNSLTESVILAVKKKAKRDTPNISDDTLVNIENGLRTQFIASRQGGNAMGSIMRRATSTALLANPLNAVLNVVEGITAPIYQNGFSAWVETVPEALVSTFSKQAGAKNVKWIDDASTGHGGQWMGELAQTSKDTFKKTSEDLSFFGVAKIPTESASLSKGVDVVGEKMYKYMGVDTVNRMGREMLGNSAVKRGVKLANAGDMDKLMKHDGMRGLSKSEADATASALKKFSKSGKDSLTKNEMQWIQNFYGASVNKWQPVSASTLPRAFHDNPNGRVMYSMLSYMNRQMNNIVDEIGLKFAGAQKAGLNTPEGQKLMKEAYANGAKYMGLFGVLAGTWNTARLGLDPSKDKPFTEVFSVEGMGEAAVADLVSNMTMGLINTRSEQYGKKVGTIESIIPAPLTAAGAVTSGLIDVVTGDGPEALARAAQTYIPGISNADRLYRMGTGSRMLTGEGTGVGYINAPLEAVGITNDADSLFRDLGL